MILTDITYQNKVSKVIPLRQSFSSILLPWSILIILFPMCITIFNEPFRFLKCIFLDPFSPFCFLTISSLISLNHSVSLYVSSLIHSHHSVFLTISSLISLNHSVFLYMSSLIHSHHSVFLNYNFLDQSEPFCFRTCLPCFILTILFF